MSYAKQTWTNNVSVANESRMNHIENGIYGNSVQIEMLQEETSQINSGLSNILGFDAYDNTKTYSLGEYCLYNNILYKCIVAITMAENWNPEHWNITSIEQETTRNIITASLHSRTQFTSTEDYQRFEIPLTVENFKIGTKLTLENGKIIIGEGVSKIKVSAGCVSLGTINTHGLFIKKNQSEVAGSYDAVSTTTYTSLVIATIGVYVTEGDVISLNYYLNNKNNTRSVDAANRTYLTVEVVN